MFRRKAAPQLELSYLDARTLLQVLREPAVDKVAMSYYSQSQLQKLIGILEQIEESGNAD